MIFVDASAMVAIVSNEAGSDRLSDVLITDETFVSSPLAMWEAVVSVRRKAIDAGRDLSAADAHSFITATFASLPLIIEPITAEDGVVAIDAFALYGRGMQSPARLNMADCFHYAVASRLEAAILFISPNEFHHTDLPSALARP